MSPYTKSFEDFNPRYRITYAKLTETLILQLNVSFFYKTRLWAVR